MGSRDHLRRVARARVADPRDADDLVHEAMLRVVTLPSVDDATVPGLLSTVVMRLAVDRARHQRRADDLTRRLAGRTDPAAPVDEAACDRSEAAWLAARLTGLPANDRAVLLSRADGHRTGAVADRLGITQKAAECALTRARRTLRALWRTTLVLALGAPVPGWLTARDVVPAACNERAQPAMCTVQTLEEAP